MGVWEKMSAVASGIKQDRIRKLPMVAASASSSKAPNVPLLLFCLLALLASQRFFGSSSSAQASTAPRCSCGDWPTCEASTARSGTGKRTQRQWPACAHRVLIVHEQHPQPLGCDRRLLALVSLMQSDGRQVSLLYRRHVPRNQQSPRTAELALRLGVRRWDDSNLDAACLRAPPALYRFSGRGKQIARLAQQGWFDMILVSVWFWNEPSFAELALPLLLAHSPRERRPPFVGLLVDDAHAVRAARLATWELDPQVKLQYEVQAAALGPRLRSLYGMADAVMHVGAADQQEERRLYGGALPGLRWMLLRTPLRAMRTTAASTSVGSSSRRQRLIAPPPTAGGLYVGFLGNGQTATNHQAITWFLTNCWEALRRAQPTLRLRLVGRIPGATYNASGSYECDRTASHAYATAIVAKERGARASSGGAVPTPGPRCGWAWGTRYAGREAAHGIDELGYISPDLMVAEALVWRAMVAPIRATTGINTKLLVALELGIPLVVSAAAAAPLGLDERHAPSLANSTTSSAAAALIADDPDAFVSATLRLSNSDATWRSVSRAALDAFQRMERSDPAASDMRALLRSACSAHSSQTKHPDDPPSSALSHIRRVRNASSFSPSAGLCEVLDPVAACPLSR